MTRRIILAAAAASILSTPPTALGFVPAAFVPLHPGPKNAKVRSWALYATTEDIESMRAGEIRKELQSYGISTKSFFEKSELVDALKKARAEGKKPVENPASETEPSGSSSPSSSSSGASRAERIKAEMEKCKSMKVGELKKELQGLGVSTKSFFEKSEFVRALAEARVDGVKKTSGGDAGAGQQEEEYDPSYRDVVMQKFNVRDPRNQSPVIDIRLGR